MIMSVINDNSPPANLSQVGKMKGQKVTCVCQSQCVITPPCNDDDDDDVEGDINRIIGDVEVKPGLHHATELGVQANQVVCESRFLMFFPNTR